MREKLFRGRIKGTKEWRYWNAFGSIAEGSTVNPNAFDEDTVGEYIGLTDKDGKKIFEGDIVISRMSSFKYTVFWEDCQFKIEDKWGNIYVPKQEFLTHIELEVIGNIHDNPELLK